MAMVSQTLKWCLVRVIYSYRALVRPWLQPCCKYVPTCSEYACLCLKHQPLTRALWLIAVRIIACNPLSPGGLDLSYQEHKEQ